MGAEHKNILPVLSGYFALIWYICPSGDSVRFDLDDYADEDFFRAYGDRFVIADAMEKTFR